MERPQLPERDLDLPDVEHEVGAIAFVTTCVGHGHRAPTAALRAHAYAVRIGAVRAERARPAGPDPAIAAVVTLFLLFHALLEELAELLHVELLEHVELVGRELTSVLRILQPVFELVQDLDCDRRNTPKMAGKCLIERVEVGLAVDAERAGNMVEAVERRLMKVERERPRERHRLLRADLELAAPELVEERDDDVGGHVQRR